MNKTDLKIILIKAVFVLQMLPFDLVAQNLVYNGDFEIYSSCPNNSGQVIRATGWIASGGTPDYFNVCSPVGVGVSVPTNFVGYQKDCCGGGRYVGEYLMCNATTPGDDSCREYIGTKLMDTLKAGHKYLASMYVNRSNLWDYSIASIGILFTDTAVVLPNPAQGPLLRANPQVKNTVVLTDTANWVLVQDTIIAVGNEAYLTIGNFNTTVMSDTVKSLGGSGIWGAYGSAYYNIDGVSVYDVLTLGVNGNEAKEVKINVYPNPNNGQMHINYSITENVDLQILDINGNLVSTYILRTDANSTSINNDKLNNGVYFYRLVKNNIPYKCQKLVIIK